MSKAIGIFVVVLCLYGGWALWKYWLKVDAEPAPDPDMVATQQISGDQLEGMPKPINAEYKLAEKQGTGAMKQFLKRYAKSIQDPRLAWIELDYAVAIRLQDPQEAQALYMDVKGRIPDTDRIYPRIRLLGKSLNKDTN